MDEPKLINPGDEVVRTDTRIAFGAKCTWWGNIYEVQMRSVGQIGLASVKAQVPVPMQKAIHAEMMIPCCPVCLGMLFEVPNYQKWEELIARHEAEYPGYTKLYMWLRGKCFTSMGVAKQYYEAEHGSLGWQPRIIRIPQDAIVEEFQAEEARRKRGKAERPWWQLFDFRRRQ